MGKGLLRSLILTFVVISLIQGVNAFSITNQSGWPVTATSDFDTTPVFSEIDGNTTNGGEVAFVRITATFPSSKSKFVIINQSGTIKEASQILKNIDFSYPSVGDLDGNRSNGLETVYATKGGGSFSLYNYYSNGTTYWSQGLSSEGFSPALADLDGDDRLEIVIGVGSTVMVYYGNGTERWNYTVSGSVNSAPALGDIDGDGAYEVVIGTNNGDLFLLDSDGTHIRNWTAGSGTNDYSSPALGDIDNDGEIEIVWGVKGTGSAAKIVGYETNGTELFTTLYSSTTSVMSSVALSDLNNDGFLEMVIGENNGQRYFAFHHNGTSLDGWPVDLFPMGAIAVTRPSPVIADVDGDLEEEILVHLFSGSGKSKFFIIEPNGTVLSTIELSGSNTYSSPAVYKNLDGQVAIALVTNNGKAYLFNTSANYSQRRAPWPMFHRDARNTGYYQVLSLYDSKDPDPPSDPSNGSSYGQGDPLKLSGMGWMSFQNVLVNINDSNGDTIYYQSWEADANGEYLNRSALTLASNATLGVYKIYASTDGGSTWELFDTFTVTGGAPEFPLGLSGVVPILSLLYVLARRPVYN